MIYRAAHSYRKCWTDEGCQQVYARVTTPPGSAIDERNRSLVRTDEVRGVINCDKSLVD